jgi:hypothetical protein
MFIVLPSCDCAVDVFLLVPLGAAAKQNYQDLAILAEVNSIARTEI